MSRQWARPILGVLLGISVVSGCGSAGSSQDAAKAAAETRAWEAIDEQANGTVAQRRANQFLIYRADQQRIADCFTRSGQTYVKAPFIDSYAGVSGLNALSDVNDRAVTTDPDPKARTGFQWSERLLTLGDQLRPMTIRTPRSSEYDQALDTCGSGGPTSAPPRSEAAQTVGDDLESILAPPGLVDKPIPGYQECVREAGFTAATRMELMDSLSAQFGPFELSDGPTIGSGPAWETAVATENTARAADVSCRAEAHTEFMNALPESAESFAKRHAKDLAEAQAAWATVEQQAAAKMATP